MWSIAFHPLLNWAHRLWSFLCQGGGDDDGGGAGDKYDDGDEGDDDDDNFDDDDDDGGAGNKGVDRQLVRMGYRFLVRGCKFL